MRRDDLEHLILGLAKQRKELFEPVEAVEKDLFDFLQTLAFPGNIRELENAVQRMLFAKTEGRSLTLADWNAQAEGKVEEGGKDLMTEVAGSFWKAICYSDLPLTRAF